jgi:hypothetical protein
LNYLIKGRILIFIITLTVSSSSAQDISYFNLPKQFQLYPRDESDNDSSLVNISGYIVGTSYDKISVEIKRNSNFWKEISQSLIYGDGDTAFFDLNPKIYAGLIEFNFEIKFSSGQSTITDSIIDSVVCGDVYLIQGQSNAAASDYGGFIPYQVEWVRTFGTTTGHSGNDTSGVEATALDTTWDLAQAEANNCHAAVGIWGLRLGKLISESYNTPVCIINGSPGGSSIKSHERKNDPFDLTSVYGRLLWRVYAAAVQENVKALIWWQGESDTGNEGDAHQYFDKFLELVSDWRSDFNGIEKIYTTQIHVGHDDAAGFLREKQREISVLDSDIEIMTAHGLGELVDEKHFYPSGYDRFAYRVFNQIERDFYNDPDTDINPPNIINAYFTDSQKNVIVLDFTEVETLVWQNDTTIDGFTRRLKDYFYFHNDDATVDSNIVDSGVVFGNLLRLALNRFANATSVSYLPHMYYNGTDIVYKGPWLKNSLNIPALSFFEFPIDNTFGPDPALAPNGIIDIPVEDSTFILVGDSVEFSGTGSSPDLLQLNYLWEFGMGSGIPNSTLEDPGFVHFDSSGIFKIKFIVTDELGITDPSPDTRIIQVARRERVSQAYWSVIFVDSEEKNAPVSGSATNAFDGDSTTLWHTEYYNADPPHPHEIQIDMNYSYEFNSFSYLPRQDGKDYGMVEDFELYISEDTTNWGSPVVTGTFAENADEKHVNFISKRGRYIRFRALSEVDGDPWTSMAEMNVYADTVFSNLPPNGFINLPTNSLEIIVGDSVEFTGSGNDANGHYPLTYLWEFGTGSGITDSNLEDPGFVTFDIPGNFTVRFTVFDSQGLPDPIPDIRNIQVIQQQIISKSSWSLVYVDSEELNSSGDIGPAVNGFDGDPNTIWHTEWIGSDPDLPHEIQIDLGAIYFLAGFNYLPRQDGPDTGTIKDYEFYVSMENTNWGTPVASGRFVENTQEKNVLFSPKHGRYIRLRALLEVDGDPYTSMAEIDIVAQDEPLPVQLSTFAGEYLGNKITLRWKTESEINNLGFIILRKKMEEELFREINNFHYLETLLGKGTTNQATAYTYIDKNIQIGETYLYLLENVDFYGNIEIHGPISVETRISSSLSGYRLYQNFPNPFNSATKIPYFLPSDNFTSIILYDLLGRKVQMLLSEKKKAGYHEFIFQPDHLRTGIYYYKIQMGDYQAVKQMLLVR